MSNPVIPSPNVTSGDRFAFTIVFAFLLHMILLLGLTFDFSLKSDSDQSTTQLDIHLVDQKSLEKPDEYKLLGQANFKTKENNLVAYKVSSSQNSTTPVPSFSKPIEKNTTQSATEVKTKTTLISPQSNLKVETSPQLSKTAIELLKTGLEIARLEEKIKKSLETSNNPLREKRVSANTTEFKYAVYLEQWRNRIETIGNINYPEQAKKKSLSGKLILDVAINADGTVSNITLVKSSGHKILDDAAIRIVKLAAPFAKFSSDIKAETDILHVIRTWKFEGSKLK